MKESLFQITMIIPIILLLCFTFGCQQGEEGITEEEAKALVERYQEIWNGGNPALADELLAPDYVKHFSDYEDIVGIDAFKEDVANARITYPDFNVTIEELIVQNDKIVSRWIWTGTNTGTTDDIPPTGKKVKISGVNILHIVNGKVVEDWFYYNEASLLDQLGFTFTAPQAPAPQEKE